MSGFRGFFLSPPNSLQEGPITLVSKRELFFLVFHMRASQILICMGIPWGYSQNEDFDAIGLGRGLRLHF